MVKILLNANDFDGYVSNARVCKGYAVYTENFTVPTRELPVHTAPPKGVVFPAADNRTVLLTCQSSTDATAEATGRHIITVDGDATAADANPGLIRKTNITSTITENTGSVFFDGTGDNLVSKSSGLAPGSGNFTAEGWFNLPSTSGISNSSLFSSGIEPVLHWALIVDTDASVEVAQPEPDTWNRIDVGFGTYVAGFLVQKSSERVLFDVGINTTSVTLDFSTELDADFYYPGWLVSNDFVNNGWINKGAVNTDADGVVTLTDSTPFRYIKMRSLTNYGGVNSTYAGIATLQGYSPLDGADYAAWGVRRSSDDGNAYLYDGADWVDTGLSISEDTWNHVAVVRDSSAMNLYVNGAGYALTSYTNSNLSNSIISVSGFNTSGNVVVDPLRGYASNVRLTLEKKLYTSGYAEPTDELNVIGGTAFVGCHDGENIFAEKTGKVIAAYGDRLSSPTPTATDSPIGITTFNPGLTRSVDATVGPTFQGGVGFVSQNWLTLPKGTTIERFPNFAGVDAASARGIISGGYYVPAGVVNVIEYLTISTLGNTKDFGDLSTNHAHGKSGFASNTRGIFAGGGSPSLSNNISYITIATTGDGKDFGDCITKTKDGSAAGNQTRGIFHAAEGPSGNTATNSLQYVTIQTSGNAIEFGDLTIARTNSTGELSSPVRGLFMGGYIPSSPNRTNTIDYVTISTTSNAVDFGDMTEAKSSYGVLSNSTRGIRSGGNSAVNTIDYITIATLGDAQDFGDLTTGLFDPAGTCASSIRGIIAGGYKSPAFLNVIQYVTISTLGNAQDFGDMTSLGANGAGLSNGHGGLG